jgi:hypothetical protein
MIWTSKLKNQMMAKVKKEFKFRRNIDLGNLEAEQDKLLLSAFVERPDYEILKDTSSSKSIIIGRTGSGKSAMIRKTRS